jgi:hypothetical protein
LERVVSLGLGGWEVLVSGGGKVGGGGGGEGRGYVFGCSGGWVDGPRRLVFSWAGAWGWWCF